MIRSSERCLTDKTKDRPLIERSIFFRSKILFEFKRLTGLDDMNFCEFDELNQIFGVLLDNVPRVIMERNDIGGVEENCSLCRVNRIHCVMSANRQNRVVNLVTFADKFHVGEKSRVAREVNNFSADADNISASNTAADTGAVERGNHPYEAEFGFDSAAEIHADSFDALTAEVNDFGNADDRRICPYGNVRSVADMVAVRMRDQNIIRLNVFIAD